MSVLDLVKHYQQTIENYADDEKVLKAINKLFKLKVTVQHLEETGVGRTVNALRKEPGEVGQAARALVCKWKVMVATEEQTIDNNESDQYNEHNSGHESNDSRSNCESSAKQSYSHREVGQQTKCRDKQKSDYGGSKRKYHSSEEDEPSSKISKQQDLTHQDVIKSEVESVDSESEEESHSKSESESSQSDKSREVMVKIENPNFRKSSKHSHSSDRSREYIGESSYPSKVKETPEKHKYKSESRHLLEKSSKEKSYAEKSSSKEQTLKYSRDKSLERKIKIEEKHRKLEKNVEQSNSSSTDKHKSSSSHKSENSSERNKSSEKSVKESTSKSHKSDKDKHKSSLEKDIKHKSGDSSSRSKDKHSSSSKHKSKDRTSSSKEKLSGPQSSSSNEKSHKSHSTDNKHSSSHESKSKSDQKPVKSDKKSEKKLDHKHSSSSHKSKSSSSQSKEDRPKKKVTISEDSDDGIGCESGASFAEALGMVISPAKPKKKSTPKDSFSPNSSFNNDLSPAALLAPSAKLAPLPAFEISALPEISPNYKPRPPPRLVPHFTDEEAISAGISSKNQRTKVYSGNKVYGKIPSLYEMCVHILQEHIDALEFTGGVPYEILKPVVDRATPQQLFILEHFNPYLMEDTDHLWQKFCEKNFRTKKRQEMESWREMYIRCQEEQEHKLKSLTANIKIAQEAKKAPIKQTKMAYVDSVVKPPRNIARKQALHGTASVGVASPAERVASLASGGPRYRATPPAPPTTAHKHKKAPLMQKALQFMRGRKR